MLAMPALHEFHVGNQVQANLHQSTNQQGILNFRHASVGAQTIAPSTNFTSQGVSSLVQAPKLSTSAGASPWPGHVDVAIFQDSRMAGYGVLIEDEEGMSVRAISGYYELHMQVLFTSNSPLCSESSSQSRLFLCGLTINCFCFNFLCFRLFRF